MFFRCNVPTPPFLPFLPPKKQFAVLHARPSAPSPSPRHDQPHEQQQGPGQPGQGQGPGIADFHRRVQKLAPWFIESAWLGSSCIYMCVDVWMCAWPVDY